ncbi:hypothetical protein BV898_06022 [Hypsibius exemplaris]|uniref:Uncharacterized protein n=1 Tax=Hypsibius exemplaris TaxID=2072580 RepID=A0A1W0WXT6_HYPEX|nr:hypothetical protein BV898_06022 [Hypsibius exemplaris]
MNTNQILRNTCTNETHTSQNQELLFSVTVLDSRRNDNQNGVAALGNGIILTATLAYRPFSAAANWLLMAHNIAWDLIMSVLSNPDVFIVTFAAFRSLLPYFSVASGNRYASSQ